jgi:predicted O-methyltransferase YrrM
VKDLNSSDLKKYLTELVPPRPAEMQAMERYAVEHRFPIVGPVAGYYCYQIARMINARSVFELASGYGYSTSWFAQAVKENGGGVVHHVVWDEELSKMARRHLSKLGFDGIIKYTVGEAVAALKEVRGTFDLIFNDIDKEAYPESLTVIEEKLKPGGVLIVDNALWGGRIFDPSNKTDSTEGVRELTRLLSSSPKWITTVAPVRDGLIVALKNQPNTR